MDHGGSPATAAASQVRSSTKRKITSTRSFITTKSTITKTKTSINRIQAQNMHPTPLQQNTRASRNTNSHQRLTAQTMNMSLSILKQGRSTVDSLERHPAWIISTNPSRRLRKSTLFHPRRHPACMMITSTSTPQHKMSMVVHPRRPRAGRNTMTMNMIIPPAENMLHHQRLPPIMDITIHLPKMATGIFRNRAQRSLCQRSLSRVPR